MMYKIIPLIIILSLSACQTVMKQSADQTVYHYDDPGLTHTTYLGPAPMVRDPEVEKE